MFFHEIKQVLWLNTPKGLALAKFLIDRGPDSDLEWVVFQQETSECWTWLNSDVRIVKNITLKRTKSSDLK